MKKEDLYEPTLWVYSPFYADLVDYIPHHGLIYDCAENMARSIPARRADLYYHQERQLCQKADVVFAATQSFYERVKAFNPQTYLVRNGIDYRPKMTLPDEVLDAIARLEKIAKPICGFAGVLNSHVDFEMLEKVANAGRGVVIATQTGTEDAAVADKIEKLSQNERILLVHCSKQTSVLEYISRFDVCVNPLKEADNTDEFSIRIFCEYLASGKPIITSPFPAIAKDYDDVADVAELGDTFLNMVLTAEERYDTARKTRQLEYAADCKWKARVAEIRRQLSEQQYLID